jgi:hypothetical protein
MAAKAMGIGLDAAISWFGANVDENCPMYSVWNGRDLLYSYTKNDYEECEEHFVSNIKGLIEQNYNDLIALRSHFMDKKERERFPYVTVKTPVTSTFFFRPVPLNDRPFFDSSKNEYNQRTGEETPYSRIARLEEKINNLEQEIEDNEQPMGAIEVQPQKQDIYSFLNNIIQVPAIQNILIGKLTSLLGGNNQQQFTPQIAGIPNNIQTMQQIEVEQAIEALNVLKQVRPQIVADLINLANIATTDPQKANLIISMIPQ